MLLPDQVVPFLLHDDLLVRDLALRYLTKANDPGTFTADHLWMAFDRFGPGDVLRGSVLAHLSSAPQTDASTRRLIDALAEKTVDDDFHLQHAIGDLDLSLLQNHRDEVLECEGILDHVREHLRERLELVDEPPEPLWDRLMDFGRELKNAYVGTFDGRRADRLIEAAARHPEMFVDRALQTLKDPSAIEDWRQIFAIRFIGEVGHEPAIDLLIAELQADGDVSIDSAQRALTKMGTLEVIEKLKALYLRPHSHADVFGDDPLIRIKRPECEAALVQILELKDELMLRLQILGGLCELGSLAGLEASRALIALEPDDPDCVDLAGSVIAVATMAGVELPETPKWRQALKRAEEEFRARERRFGKISEVGMFKEMRDNWRATGISDPPKTPGTTEKAQHKADQEAPPAGYQPPEAINRQASKVGRNDPCPCGSGKKYKKCCIGT